MVLRAYSEKYLAEFVYGATDGTVTTFAIVSGVVGASLSPSIVLVLGLANVLADGFSMAASNFLAARSEEALQHGLLPVVERKAPLKTALITFVSFVAIGLIPLLPFGAALFIELPYSSFALSIVLTVAAFSIIGSVRGIIARKPVWKSSLETLLVGGLAAVISFAVGYFLRGLA